MSVSTWDVAIIGGGPSGSASAISLRQTFPSLRVLVVEASDYLRQRAGEVLPPAARGLLEHLKVLPMMWGEHDSPAVGLACSWGSPQLDETNYFYSTSGTGWHLERNRFDAMLVMQAEACGAELWRRTLFHFAEREEGIWQLQLSGGRQAQARWVIDATGRNATFARTQGAKRQAQDFLTAFSCIFQEESVREARTLIESCAHGWWYTAPLPGGRRVVSLLTDADLGRQLRLTDAKQWQRELASSIHVCKVVEKASVSQRQFVRSAATVTLARVYGDGWLATGDASAAFDPLSAQGITSALRSGILAAFAVGDVLRHGDTSVLERYAAILRAQAEGFARSHLDYYSREQRWSDHPFWVRRQQQERFRSTPQLLGNKLAV